MNKMNEMGPISTNRSHTKMGQVRTNRTQATAEIIERTVAFVKERLEGEGTGHDYWHIHRVWKLAKQIAAHETSADLFTVELAALLHDIADWKFHDGDITAGPRVARQWLEKCALEYTSEYNTSEYGSELLSADNINRICRIIEEISFKGAKVASGATSLEAKIVQDADRLDALGAIGIARCFAYGGHKGNMLYDPNLEPKLHNSFEEYKNSTGTSINHFYEKLLLLKDTLNTKTAKNMAEERHVFMESFLKQFFKEWNVS